MSTLKSSAENLILFKHNSAYDIKFQSNAVEKASRKITIKKKKIDKENQKIED